MPRSSPPTRRQLHAAAERSLLAAVLFGAAAMLASRSGHGDQVWPYLAMAVAVLPQALLALVARVDAERHVRVRVSQRPIWVNAAVGTVLAGAALVLLVREGPGSVEAWSAALGGVAGLLAAVPPVLVAPRRRRAPEPAAERALIRSAE
jgi:membrane associated rhomboid family serine protease